MHSLSVFLSRFWVSKQNDTLKFCNDTLNSERQDMVLPCIEVKRIEERMFSCTWLLQQMDAIRAGLRGGGAIAPGPPLQGSPRDEICLFEIKYSFQKFLWLRSCSIQEYNSLIFLCCVKYQGPLISLQVWLSASFSNCYWKAYNYFRFCSMQIYLIFLLTFS